MSVLDHSGWPVEALRMLARAKRLRGNLHTSMSTTADQDPEIKRMEREIEGLKKQITVLNDKILARRLLCNSEQRKVLPHIQQEIETLTNKAKELKQQVPPWINEFILFISQGVNWSAGFQIVWWNERFVIMRLPGRKYWSARSQAYAKSETKMYDRQKFEKYKIKGRPRGDGFAATDCERDCCVKNYEGKISIHVLKDWKEEADYVSIPST
jgi:hypothetical protein